MQPGAFAAAHRQTEMLMRQDEALAAPRILMPKVFIQKSAAAAISYSYK